MDDVFCEQIVADERKERGTWLRILLIVLAVGIPVAGYFIDFVRTYLLLLLTIISFTAVLFFWRRCFNEYEYVFTDGQLDIDRIFSKQTRKHLATISSKEIMLVAPVTYKSYQKTYNLQYDVTIDASDHLQGEKRDYGKYYLLAKKGERTLKLKFQPNEQLLKMLKTYAPHKVILEGAPERPIQM